MNDRHALITLNMTEGIGPVGVRSLFEKLGSYSAIMDADEKTLSAAPGIGRETARKIISGKTKMNPEAETEAAAKLGVRIVTCIDSEYPRSLLQIHDPPLVLYVKGSIVESDSRSIGVVGTRRPTSYGRTVADTLSYRLAQADFTIVSGLARGIDTTAHRAAIKGKGRTIAVTGGGLDDIYPPENRELAEEIAENGAVASEFPIGKRPDKTTFPMRNRIVSGISMGVLVVEAGQNSGALITAGQALDQGKTVFAVPGRIDSPASRGTHELIKTGACLVTGVDSIFEEFEMLISKNELRNNNDPCVRSRTTLLPDEMLLVKILEDGGTDVDSLTRKSGMPPGNVASLLIGLEMKRIVRMLPGRNVELTGNI